MKHPVKAGLEGTEALPTTVKPSVDARLHDLIEYRCVYLTLFSPKSYWGSDSGECQKRAPDCLELEL